MKRLLPVGLNLFAGREQELVQHCKDRFLKKLPEYEIIGTFCAFGRFQASKLCFE